MPKKRIFQWISPKMLQNNRKIEFSYMWHILRRETDFINIYPFLLVWSKRVVYTKFKFSTGFAPIQNCWAKPTFWVILSCLLRVNFLIKRVVFSEFSRKWFKQIGERSLALYGLYWGETKYFVNICPNFLVWKMQLFSPNSNFPLDFTFSNLMRKTNILSVTALLSEVLLFWLKREFFSEFPRKCFKTT